MSKYRIQFTVGEDSKSIEPEISAADAEILAQEGFWVNSDYELDVNGNIFIPPSLINYPIERVD